MIEGPMVDGTWRELSDKWLSTCATVLEEERVYQLRLSPSHTLPSHHTHHTKIIHTYSVIISFVYHLLHPISQSKPQLPWYQMTCIVYIA